MFDSSVQGGDTVSAVVLVYNGSVFMLDRYERMTGSGEQNKTAFRGAIQTLANFNIYLISNYICPLSVTLALSEDIQITGEFLRNKAL